MLDVQARLARGWIIDLRSNARRVGIFGPSGAGKTTLLRVLAGLEPVEGRVVVGKTVFQDSASRLPPWQRSVGWVPQEATLFPHASVDANLRWAGASKGDAKDLARELGVDHLLDRRPRHLSGGERQRVALGRALLALPRVLLLDEPFGALDPELRATIVDLVDRWLDSHDAVLVLVSHDRGDLARLCDDLWEARSDGGLRRLAAQAAAR